MEETAFKPEDVGRWRNEFAADRRSELETAQICTPTHRNARNEGTNEFANPDMFWLAR